MREYEQVDIKRLTLLENNPRKISKEQMNKLIVSLETDPDFLLARPILVNKTYKMIPIDGNIRDLRTEAILTVYAGNQRVQAAKKLKWKSIPCIIEENLKDEVMNRRVILDNKSFGEFDYDILANEFEIDMLLECGLELKDLGSFNDVVEQISPDSKAKDDKKKSHECPSCGYSF